tara:strand:+ start:57 stop:332 length:276 start_codon:yes stop_codon:yes gene_type:complete
MRKGSRNVPRSKASKTTKFYWKNKVSRDHHSDTNNSGSPKGEFSHTKKYKKEHIAAQKRLNTVGKKKDVEKRKGKWVKLSIGYNRGPGRLK